MSSKLMVFTGDANPELARKVASRLSLSLGKADVGRFSDGEIAVELNENVRGKEPLFEQVYTELGIPLRRVPLMPVERRADLVEGLLSP